jgi:hypothetical protein
LKLSASTNQSEKSTKSHPVVRLPNIIDIEASGFGSHSYPIEVGVVRSDGQRFCRIIKPFDDWTHWQEDAAKVHNISRQQLNTLGASGVEICLQLNEFLKGGTVYSDGWQVDSAWLNKLFDRAQVAKTFYVSSLEMILSEHQMNIWHATKESVIQSLNITRHRASNDALVIQKTYQQSSNK